VREMQWHQSEKIVKDGKHAVVATFELGDSVEFKRWLLGSGPAANVLGPASLFEEVARDLEQASGPYDHVRKGAEGLAT